MRFEILRNCSFGITWFLILMISVIDGYLVWRCDSVIRDVELNPVGAWMLHVFDGNIWPFLGFKIVGTIMVCMFLLVLYRNSPRMGIMVTFPIALMQLFLLAFLTM